MNSICSHAQSSWTSRPSCQAHFGVVLSYLKGQKQRLQCGIFIESFPAASSRSIVADQLEKNHHSDKNQPTQSSSLYLHLAGVATLGTAFQNSAAAREKTTRLKVSQLYRSHVGNVNINDTRSYRCKACIRERARRTPNPVHVRHLNSQHRWTL